LHHLDDWTQYLAIIDEKLAATVDQLEAAVADGTLDWPALEGDAQ
jgi:adenosylhomocysteine nucleosidase